MFIRRYVHDKDHMSALLIKNTSQSDPRSYEVTWSYFYFHILLQHVQYFAKNKGIH